MIRKATHADIGQLLDLSCESVTRDPLPVKVDRDGMRTMALQVIGNPAHFAWVAEEDGTLTAAVAAVVQPGFWFRGLQASVILFYARETGEGVRLIREFARWAKSRGGIKLAVFELEPGADERIERLLRRLGFARRSTNMTYVRQA
jgi:GNAT superfamily N-acetyltransferase